MCDFDLANALDCPLDLDVTGSESSCFGTKEDAQDKTYRLEEGLDLVVSLNPKTMKGVVNLVLAVNRMKMRKQELSNDELYSIIIDSVVDVKPVVKTEMPCTGGERRCFSRMDSGKEGTLVDTDQKSLICASEDFKLQAVTLKGGYNDRKVNFKLAQYLPSAFGDSSSDLTVLSIKQSNLHVSCSMHGDEAVLNLETCSKESLMNISDDMERFLFYKRTIGRSLIKFESVRCPTWFISTSSDENHPVEMCRQETHHRLTNFRMI